MPFLAVYHSSKFCYPAIRFPHLSPSSSSSVFDQGVKAVIIMATNTMDENQIAMAESSILLGWRPFDSGERLKLEREKVELAISRARAANRHDYEKVLEEVMLAILFQVGRIVRETIDRPVLGALTTEEVEEDGEACGGCQEDMAKGIEAYAMECKHKFHQDCIFSCLKIKDTCPLCRYQMKFEGYVF